MTQLNNPRVTEVLPALAEELRRDFDRRANPALTNQLDHLRIVDVCPCPDEFCGSFYTAPRPTGAWSGHVRTLQVGTDKGMVLVDVVDDLVKFIEVLGRPDDRAALRRAVAQ